MDFILWWTVHITIGALLHSIGKELQLLTSSFFPYIHVCVCVCPVSILWVCNHVTSWNPNGTNSKGRPHVMNKSVSKYELSRYIKLSSPRLNNMAVVGCILVYMAVILLGLDHATLPTNTHFSAVCTVSTSICNQSSKYMVQNIPIQLVKKFPTLLILKIHYLANKGSLVDIILSQTNLVPPPTSIAHVFITHFNTVTSFMFHILNSGQIFWSKIGN